MTVKQGMTLIAQTTDSWYDINPRRGGPPGRPRRGGGGGLISTPPSISETKKDNEMR